MTINHLNHIREAAGDKVDQLAAELGVSKERVLEWEAGERIPEPYLGRLSKRYGVQPHWLSRPDCEVCGEPASYTGGRLADTVCETCAAIDHGDKIGASFAAAEMFMVAAQVAHSHGLTVGDLHTCVTEAVGHDDDRMASADVPRLSYDELAPGRDRHGWRRLLKPVA